MDAKALEAQIAVEDAAFSEMEAENCLCIFCAGIAAVCSGTSSRGVCSCGFCCKRIQVSFGLTEQDMRDDQDRIAEFVESELEREIWMAEADWLSVDDFLGFLANGPSAVTALE